MNSIKKLFRGSSLRSASMTSLPSTTDGMSDRHFSSAHNEPQGGENAMQEAQTRRLPATAETTHQQVQDSQDQMVQPETHGAHEEGQAKPVPAPRRRTPVSSSTRAIQEAFIKYTEFKRERARYHERSEDLMAHMQGTMAETEKERRGITEFEFADLHRKLKRFREYVKIMTKAHNKMMSFFSQAFPSTDDEEIKKEDKWLEEALARFDVMDTAASLMLDLHSDQQAPHCKWPPSREATPAETPDRMQKLEKMLEQEHAASSDVREDVSLKSELGQEEDTKATYQEQQRNPLISAQAMPEPTKPTMQPMNSQAVQPNNLSDFFHLATMLQQPKARITAFSGKPEEDFLAFKTAFNSVFPATDTWSSEEFKLEQLKSNLRGTALLAIANLHPGPKVMKEAWHKLDQRFGNKDIVLARLQKQFDEMPPATNGSQTIKMRNVLDAILTTLNNHASFGETFDGPPAIRIWLQKLPKDFHIQWVKQTKCQRVQKNAEDFTDFLGKYIALQEEVQINHQNQNQQEDRGKDKFQGNQRHQKGKWQSKSHPMNGNKNGHNQGRPNPPTANTAGSAALLTANARASESTRKCAACDKKIHFLGNCPKFLDMNVEARKAFLENHNFCKRCIKKGHSTDQCATPEYKTKCMVAQCNDPASHNTLLH